MNYEKAKQITAEHAPGLIVDPLNPSQPDMFIVRKTKNGMPFSIHLSHIDPSTLTDIEAKEAQPEQAAQPGIEGHPGVPYQPARPAIPGKTVAEQQDEQERAMLIGALDAAVRQLGIA